METARDEGLIDTCLQIIEQRFEHGGRIEQQHGRVLCGALFGGGVLDQAELVALDRIKLGRWIHCFLRKRRGRFLSFGKERFQFSGCVWAKALRDLRLEQDRTFTFVARLVADTQKR